MQIVNAAEKWFIGLLGLGILYTVLKNSKGTGAIIRETTQGIAGLTTVASGGAKPSFGYSVNNNA